MLDFAVDIAETQLPREVNCVLYHFYWRVGGKTKNVQLALLFLLGAVK